MGTNSVVRWQFSYFGESSPAIIIDGEKQDLYVYYPYFNSSLVRKTINVSFI